MGGALAVGFTKDLFRTFVGAIEGRGDAPAENLGGPAALHDVVVVGPVDEFVGDDFGPEVAVANGNSGMKGTGFRRGEMDAMSVEHSLEGCGRELLHVVEAETDGTLSGKAFVDHLFVADEVIAFVVAVGGPGEFACGAQGGEAAGGGVFHGAKQHIHHGRGFETALREINLVLRVEFKSAAADGVVSIDTEKAEVVEQALVGIRFLCAKTALAVAQTFDDVGGEKFPQRVVGTVKEAGVVSVLEPEEKRLLQHSDSDWGRELRSRARVRGTPAALEPII